jgi:hypothetical protein
MVDNKNRNDIHPTNHHSLLLVHSSSIVGKHHGRCDAPLSVTVVAAMEMRSLSIAIAVAVMHHRRPPWSRDAAVLACDDVTLSTPVESEMHSLSFQP